MTQVGPSASGFLWGRDPVVMDPDDGSTTAIVVFVEDNLGIDDQRE